jgi:hypothetical protein
VSNNFAEVPHGIIYSHLERLEELNERISQRNLPDRYTNLKPNFDVRSAPTRNRHTFPILSTKPIHANPQHMSYSTTMNFAPIQSKGPFEGYLSNVQKENHLRNQVFPLKHGDDDSIYIPSSKGDLYNVTIPITRRERQPFTELFYRPTDYVTSQNNFINDMDVGKNFFNNPTRTQLKISF